MTASTQATIVDAEMLSRRTHNRSLADRTPRAMVAMTIAPALWIMIGSVPDVEARPAARGVYTEVGIGGATVIGNAQPWLQPGPALGLRVGYDLWSWLALGIATDGATHEATVPAPPVGEYMQLYRARAEARLTVRLNAVAVYVEGGAGGAMVSSNVLGKVGVTDPGERFSLAFGGGGGLEYQLQNRHYAVGIGGDYWLAPGFAALQGVTVRAFLRYTYGGAH